MTPRQQGFDLGGDFVHAVIRFDVGEGSLRWLVSRLIEQTGQLDEEVLRERADDECRRICHEMALNGTSLRAVLEDSYTVPMALTSCISHLQKTISEVIGSVQETDEVGSLLNGFEIGRAHV